MVKARHSILLLAFLLAAPAAATEVAGVALADEIRVGGHALVLNGAGVGSKMFFKIYVGSLYVPRKVVDVDGVFERGPRRIQMNFLRDLTVKQLVSALVGGLNANNSPSELAAIAAPTEELLRIMTRFGDLDVRDKDVLTLDFIDGATRVSLNGQSGGVIPGDAFNRALTRIWLGDKPAHRGLKKAMLGG
jgi:long-chain acyl-CoA synthetase